MTRSLSPAERLRIIVLGYIVRGPIGGMAWHHLQYVVGLARLGHDVWFVEDSDEYPSCYQPDSFDTTADPTYGLEFTKQLFRQIGLERRWAFYDWHTSTWHGPAATNAEPLCKSADLVINLSEMNPIRPWLNDVPRKVLVDTDPVFTQVRHLTDPLWMNRANEHQIFLTFGGNVGESGCRIPSDGLPWRATRQPVVLDLWLSTTPPEGGSFTTVMQWDSYERREWNGVVYGMKSDSFGRYSHLPSSVSATLELAVGGNTAPRATLSELGWSIADPGPITRNPWTYQRYIASSSAEFSIAKQGYVVSHSGWFSERSTGYLASGRAVVIQDTGFTDWMPSSTGIIPFHDLEEAREGIERVNRNLAAFGAEARRTAREVFNSESVLTELLAACELPPSRPSGAQ